MERNEPNLLEIQQFARVLTIAGSDSGGCAGIQADLRTFAALKVHGLCAVTAVTAQDTLRVHSSFNIPVEFIEKQIRVVIEDIGVDAVKTGMLPSAAIVSCVASQVRRYRLRRIVVDPVMLSTGGDPLMEQEAASLLVSQLLPLATVATPNLNEAELLVERQLKTRKEIERAARDIWAMGPKTVLIKGGHSQHPDLSNDIFFDGEEHLCLEGERIDTKNTHGSGCTLAAAIAAFLAKGLSTRDSVFEAKKFVQKAIQNSYSLGKGYGPLGHFSLSE